MTLERIQIEDDDDTTETILATTMRFDYSPSARWPFRSTRHERFPFDLREMMVRGRPARSTADDGLWGFQIAGNVTFKMLSKNSRVRQNNEILRSGPVVDQ